MQTIRAGTALVMVALAGTLSGCLGWEQARYTREIETTFLLPAGAGLDARSANGSIDIGEGVRNDVLVRATVRAITQERADAVQITGSADSGDLEIRALWPDRRRSSEGVSYVIEAPGGRAVRARSSNGSINVTGFEGGVFADTSNGRVTITGHDGPIEADSSNGRITIVNATDRVKATTSNGRISVTLADFAAGPVDLDTSNGAIDLVVGPGFAGIIEAETSNGAIGMTDRSDGAVTSLYSSRREKVYKIRDGETESKLDTSNGSVDVTIRG